MFQWLEKLKNKLILFLLFLSCSISFEKSVLREERVEKRKTITVDQLNLENALNEGYYEEVEEFLSSRKEKENLLLNFARGKVLIKNIELDEALDLFFKILKDSSPLNKFHKDSLWQISLCFYFKNDFKNSFFYAEEATKKGRYIDEGFRNFLKNSPEKLYKIEGIFDEVKFDYLKKKLPFLDIEINEKIKERAVIDTGASLSFISLSMAKKLNLPIKDEFKSKGVGIHGKLITLWFSFLDSIKISNLKIYNVPVMVFKDEDLTFGRLKIEAGLGFHLLKEGVIRIDYRNKKFSFFHKEKINKDFGNLIMLGLRPGVKASINGFGWYNFIIDTGSEKTILTENGSKKALITEKLNFFDVITRGIGKAKVEYRKVENATIGFSSYKVWFSNIILKKEETKYIDGIIGNDFLENFILVLDFKSKKIFLKVH